jgi:hypothetical protein
MSECLQDSDMYRQQRDAQEDEWERDLLERELEADPQRTDCGMLVLQELLRESLVGFLKHQFQIVPGDGCIEPGCSHRE